MVALPKQPLEPPVWPHTTNETEVGDAENVAKRPSSSAGTCPAPADAEVTLSNAPTPAANDVLECMEFASFG